MAPNTFKFEKLDAFATIDKALFTRKVTPLLSNEEKSTRKRGCEEVNKTFGQKEETKQHSSHNKIKRKSDDEYWDWCNDETASERKARANKKLLAEILLEEENRLFFSIKEVEKRLIEAKESSDESLKIASGTAGEGKDAEYWTWKSDQDSFAVTALEKNLISEGKLRDEATDFVISQTNEQEFWEWRNDETPMEKRQKEKDQLLANILLEEEIHREFLVLSIEKRLLDDARVEKQQESKQQESSSSQSDYWGW